nr:hypothetical protein OG546_49360 [Streptomyces antimycoticus]
MAENHQLDPVQSAAAELESLAGTPPRIITEPEATRIETDVNSHLACCWPQVLEVLDRGAAFGLTLTDTGQVAWLRIPRETGTRP